MDTMEIWFWSSENNEAVLITEIQAQQAKHMQVIYIQLKMNGRKSKNWPF